MSIGNEPIEWCSDIETLVDRLDEESTQRDLTREERALIDVVETVQILQEDDGLHGFWQSDLAQSRIINSFDLVGATEIVDALNSSQWCETRNEDRGAYTETETDHLASIEEELFEALSDITERVEEFIEDELG